MEKKNKPEFKKYYLDRKLEDNFQERWVPALGYEELYEVSNKGRVKSLPREKRALSKFVKYYMTEPLILKQSLTKKRGRIIDTRIQLNFYGKVKMHQVSRLVYFSFNRDADPNDGELVFKKNKIGYDNRLRNLKKGTVSESKAYDPKPEKTKKQIEAAKKNIVIAREKWLEISNTAVKTCKECGEEKDAKEFILGNNRKSKTCNDCQRKRLDNLKKKSKKHELQNS